MLTKSLKVMCKKQCLILGGVVVAALLASCAPTPTATPTPQAPVSTPTAKPTLSTTPVPQSSPTQTPALAKSIELKFSTSTPETHLLNRQVFNPFVAQVEKATGGRVKVIMYPSEVLGKAPAQYDIVRKGTADIALILPSEIPGRFALLSLLELPFLVPNAATGTEAAWQLYKEGYFKNELGEVEVLAIKMTSPYHMMSKKPVATLEDFKGMKIRVASMAEKAKVKKSLEARELYPGRSQQCNRTGRIPHPGC